MDRRLIGFCVALVCVFGFGYFSGSSSNEGPHKTGTSAELRAISSTADDLAVQLPEFKELSKKLAKIEASLPEFATKKDVELAVAQARDAITDEIETTAKLYSAHEVSYQDDSKLAQMELAITDLRNRVADLEKSCSEASKLSASQPAKSGGSNGSLSYSVAAPVVTYGEVVVSNSNGSWGSSVRSPVVSSGHWSYPGNITSHLANDHGVMVSGSLEAQLSAHDAIHEGRGLTRTVTRSNVQSGMVAGDCPGGFCPAQSGTTTTKTFSMPSRGGLFSRFRR